MKRRSPCPVACTLDLIGDRWTLLIIRDLACGRATFKEFLRSPEKIATNVLTDRLFRLVSAKIVEKYPNPDSPGRDAYRLTERGRALVPVLSALAEWGLRHIPHTEARMKLTVDSPTSAI